MFRESELRVRKTCGNNVVVMSQCVCVYLNVVTLIRYIVFRCQSLKRRFCVKDFEGRKDLLIIISCIKFKGHLIHNLKIL